MSAIKYIKTSDQLWGFLCYISSKFSYGQTLDGKIDWEKGVTFTPKWIKTEYTFYSEKELLKYIFGEMGKYS